MRFCRPLYYRIEKHALMCDIMLWKTFIRVSIDVYTHQALVEMYFTIQQLLKTCVQGETNKDLNESGVEDRHLVASFENNCVADGRFERVVTQNFFRNRQISSETPEFFFHAFLRPKCTLGTKKPNEPDATTPKTRLLFQKTWWKRVKEYSFTLQIERDIVEDDLTVILTSRLTL